MKNKKFNFRALTIPLFVLITANLVASVAFSVSAMSKQNTTQTSGVYTTINQTLMQQPTTSTAMFLQATQHLNNTNNVTIKSKGEIKTFTTQKISITKMYDGATHFSQNITTGLKNAANRIYYTKNYAVVSLKEHK